ncbi:hypothetical protein Q7C36_006578 [Tachysurus vachellii]|uniref:Uncharacterized protein n=1 Tax=Tachysurus vachellii TaxID=175792 RepID=A0AA88NJN6_TACVA|nr:hypothetical protein Q7C36_006578 [Tachysurus vachellii]
MLEKGSSDSCCTLKRTEDQAGTTHQLYSHAADRLDSSSTADIIITEIIMGCRDSTGLHLFFSVPENLFVFHPKEFGIKIINV